MKILFIHHSTGANLIKEGKLRELIGDKSKQVELFDHSYNLRKLPNSLSWLNKLDHHTGLSDGKGKMLNTDYDIQISNNSPKEYAEVFSRSAEDDTLRQILQYDVILFKNCYPTSNIPSDEMLEQHKSYYLTIRDGVNRFPDKKFILMTPPPLRAELTNSQNATRARRVVEWLCSPEFLPLTSNLEIFNLFGIWADTEGENKDMLNRKYCKLAFWDGHPNRIANQVAAKYLAEFLVGK